MPIGKRIENMDKNMRVRKVMAPSALMWISAMDRRLALRGLAWFKENRGRFCRLPLRAQGCVSSDVWALAQCPAGANVAFRSDAVAMAVRVTNTDASHMAHMAATGSNGVALECGVPGRMRPWAVAQPDLVSPSFERQLFNDVPEKMREFRLYLPLYKGLEKLELGFSHGSRILPPAPPALRKPVVFYGTSITQGGCAGTAANDYVSCVGRLLNIETINLGFSGNGKYEPEMAKLIGEIDAALFVLDYANIAGNLLRRRLPPFASILRARHPRTPILLITPTCYSAYDWSSGNRTHLDGVRDVMLMYYVRCRPKDRNLHLVDGYGLIPFGADSAHVDGGHPNDHGFRLIADRLAPLIEQILMRDS
ncbi:MAG: SGNH/GDSL hydrolase family protein [Verrucomicrobia bacterium]|nr:SGNH/GDSL hydrolase family protein [Verrucomicrobiota bacterium]MBU4291381.1 SGNH/GDSL hydrolase family protein [Verrucomicrobiota bacterium]MBU4497424.1 SGNH/GDSL hydrolase family protein [Verrucomicrobiota bacterium]MCG2680079.1 SGNH/GDSL hydrolase family protein [Kiritimatiellia bacterium]